MRVSNLASGLPWNKCSRCSCLIEVFVIMPLLIVIAKHHHGDDYADHQKSGDEIQHEGAFRPRIGLCVTILHLELAHLTREVTTENADRKHQEIEDRPDDERRDLTR